MPWDKSKKGSNIPKKTLEDIFKPSEDLEIDDGLKVGVYSRSKMGKTHFGASAAEFATRGPVYIIDTENNVKKETTRLSKEMQSRIFVSEVMKLENAGAERTQKVDVVASMELLFEAADVLTDVIQASLVDNDDVMARGTVVIDSGTDVWKWLGIWLDEVASTKSNRDGSMPRYEWGKANKRYTEFMYMLLNSNWNVIMTFRSEGAVSDKGEDLGFNKARWQKDTDFWLDLIGELTHDGKDFYLTFKGDRFGMLKGGVKDPTFERVVDEIEAQSGAVIK